MNQNHDYDVTIYSMGDAAYNAYCRGVGVSPEKAAQGAIVYAEYQMEMDTGSKGIKYYEGTIAKFREGSTLDVGFEQWDEEAGQPEKKIVPLPVIRQTKVQPPFVKHWGIVVRVLCVVSDAWLEENLADRLAGNQLDLFIMCDDADALESRIRSEMPMYEYLISNFQRQMKEAQNFTLLMAIFLYGFITVIALIGVTNIFNTVTTNMELRSREFAMLKSVGMTRREFRRMVQLESVFYGGGALCIGIPLGCVLSKLFYIALGFGAELPYEFPVTGILIAAAAVALLLFVIMRYSMGKIDRRDIVGTIQNENI